MTFLPNGPDIPADLVAAQERGEAIFVCGAGVSKTVGLPLFRGLVEEVYQTLREDWNLHAAEREGMRTGGRLSGQYDRVLRCLERRLAGSHDRPNRGMRERIRAAVRESLHPAKATDLANHAALLKLSRNAEDETRLVTTNFDTLFERAWRDKFAGAIASDAGPAMPQPKTSRCTGVLHLHGRIEDEPMSLTETDLVLTSAEFGEAYLRSGWASRYVYDLVRAYTVVLVGYEAEDPPMRYLLEALESDRERFTDLQKVYAFAPCTPGNEDLETAIWRAKAVEPILYVVDGDDHSALYETIREWQRYAEDPTDWRRQRLRPLLEQDPRAAEPEAVSKCVALLSHGDATQLLKELSPAASWLPVLMQNRVFEKAKTTPGEWIGVRINDPHMIRVCAGLVSIDEDTAWYIERAIERGKDTLSALRKKAWRLILSAKKKGKAKWFNDRWYQIIGRIRQDHADFALRRIITEILRPAITVEQPVHWLDEQPADDGPETLRSLLRISFETERDPRPEEIGEKWPQAIEAEITLFRGLARTLEDALEEADDVLYLEGLDRADNDVPSVARHGQNAHRRGFYPIVRVLADLWDRVAAVDADRLSKQVREWRRSRFGLLRRLALYAMAHRRFAPKDVADTVMSLDNETFWQGGARIEIMRLLVGRWLDFEAVDRERIEERMRAGFPRELIGDRKPDDAHWQSIRDSSIYRRLERLRSGGLPIGPASEALLAEISERHPSWRPSPGDKDDFGTWFESWSGPIGHPDHLKEIADEDLVQTALRLQRERAFEESDVWRMFCSSDPERALRGLVLESERERWDPEAWRSLLWEAGDKSGTQFETDFAHNLLRMPEHVLNELLGSATSWLQKYRESLSRKSGARGDLFLELWDRFADLAYVADKGEGPDADSDLLTRALNEPGGILAWAMRDRLVAAQPAKDGGLGADIESRLTRAVEARGTPGLLARAHLMRSLAYLDLVAPAWTTRFLLPLLDWKHGDSVAMWCAYAHGQIGSARLFNAVKPAMLEAFTRPDLSDLEFEGLIAKLVSVGIWHQMGEGAEYLLDEQEIRRVLTVGPRSVLKNAAWIFWRFMADAENEPRDKGERWRSVVGPLFKIVWPLGASLRSEEISQRLVDMATECQGEFPDAVDAIVDVVVPFRLYQISHSLRLEPHHKTLPREYPSAFLKLLNALIDPERHPIPTDLAEVLQECRDAKPDVANEATYRRLYGLRRLRGA